MYTNQFHIFAGKAFDELERLMLESARNRIQTEAPECLLNVDEGAYAAHIVDSFTLVSVAIDFDSATVSTHEEEIAGRALSAV